MMRLGCGSHAVHGRPRDIVHKDPVCGMDVDPLEGYGRMFRGQLYRFCTRSCLDKFDASPERYIGSKEEAS